MMIYDAIFGCKVYTKQERRKLANITQHIPNNWVFNLSLKKQ